ncbi:MAG: hypothetical protein ACREQY_19190 [Candidatus Binatia bacterium]
MKRHSAAAIRRARGAGFVLGAIACALVLDAPAAFGQCFLEYDIQASPAVTNSPGTSQATIRGTFDCGVASGTVCASGTSVGSCAESHFEGEAVSCDGVCTPTLGGGVSCTGTALWHGDITGDCIGPACASEGTGISDLYGPSTTTGAAVLDPADLEQSVVDCAGAGVSQAHYYGASSIPVPAP